MHPFRRGFGLRHECLGGGPLLQRRPTRRIHRSLFRQRTIQLSRRRARKLRPPTRRGHPSVLPRSGQRRRSRIPRLLEIHLRTQSPHRHQHAVPRRQQPRGHRRQGQGRHAGRRTSHRRLPHHPPKPRHHRLLLRRRPAPRPLRRSILTHRPLRRLALSLHGALRFQLLVLPLTHPQNVLLRRTRRKRMAYGRSHPRRHPNLPRP